MYVAIANHAGEEMLYENENAWLGKGFSDPEHGREGSNGGFGRIMDCARFGEGEGNEYMEGQVYREGDGLMEEAGFGNSFGDLGPYELWDEPIGNFVMNSIRFHKQFIIKELHSSCKQFCRS